MFKFIFQGRILSNFCKYAKDIQVRQKSQYLKHSPNTYLNKSIINRYKKLKRPKDKVPVTYIWIDGTGEFLRSKMRTLDHKPSCVEEIPQWAFDGSSTYQATGAADSELLLRPCAMYKDPFMPGGVLVLCDTLTPDGDPTETNHRVCALDAADQICHMKPWFGFEQEYTFMDMNGKPFGFPDFGFPRPQGPYYCSVGADVAWGREITDSHYYACCHMGLAIGGTNAEVLPSQWEYQIGPSEGIDIGDELWISRYVLWRIAEEYGVCVSLDPKPVPGDWNGTGNHCNVSTEEMRADNGIKAIETAIEKLKAKHKRHILVYDPKKGEDNKRRLTGKHETASYKEFTSGVGSRAVSVRIGREVAKANKGWFEDRRPSANCDPYQVINVIMRTCFLDQ